MERFLKEFEVQPKGSSDEALRRWRSAVTIVKNRRRRFRMVADLEKRSEAERNRQRIQEKIRVALYIQKAALQFIDDVAISDLISLRGKAYGVIVLGAGVRQSYDESTLDEFRQAGFEIDADKLSLMIKAQNHQDLEAFKGVEGIARRLSVSLDKGICTIEQPLLPIRQKLYGMNIWKEKPSKSFWLYAWEALQDSTLIILLVCAIISVILGAFAEGWPKCIYDGISITVSVLLVVMLTAISDYQQVVQFQNLEQEKKKKYVLVSRDGQRRKVLVHDLVVGDVVHLYNGDQVPADGILISGSNLLVDESSLSGESEPVKISKESPFLLSGMKVHDGSGRMLVTSVGVRTSWGRLMETLDEIGEDETPLQVMLNGVATFIGKIGLFISILTFLALTVRFLVEKAIQNQFLDWSSSDILELLNYVAVVVALVIVAVPEGLPLAVTLSLAFAMQKLINDRLLIRHLYACETMGSVTCICTDKTGTLTTNHMVVEKIWISDKVISCMGTADSLRSTISLSVLDILLQSIFQNTEAEVVRGKGGEKTIMGTPTETALLEFGLLLGGDFNAQRRLFRVLKLEPFNSFRKKMSVLVACPDGELLAFCKGASEIVLEMCDKIIDSNGEFLPLTNERRDTVMVIINNFSSEALRTLCLAFRNIENTSVEGEIPSDGYTLVAVIGIKDPIRPGVKSAVQTCLAAGISVQMVTGDNVHTAKAIAKECGILTNDGLALEGPEFRSKSPAEMKVLVPKIQVLARSTPLDKHILVTCLRDEFREKVAVTGDGTNDAPALKKADIGLSMGIAGTEVARENADAIILDDNFKTIVNLVKWGRAVYINIQKFVQYQLTVSMVTVMFSFVSACISGSVPLTVVQLLWVNLIVDSLGALALATEPPNDDLMKQPPVRQAEGFINKSMWRNIFGQSIYQLAVLVIFNFDGKQVLGLSGSDADDILNTFIFNTFIFFEVFTEINCREVDGLNVFHGLFNSWKLLVVTASVVVFQVIIVEFLGTFANTVQLSWQLWLLSIFIGSTCMLAAAVLKCIPLKRDTVSHRDGYEALPCGPDLA
ncbi:Cation-transporting P-type ATPase, N-terminal [Dillenia turbinata]|uniref:Calcium-transporting ATPase n=1 Tax=Dillenia turbinata TaxID=194707 RepID=A0AAN8ZL37_9MAGN